MEISIGYRFNQNPVFFTRQKRDRWASEATNLSIYLVRLVLKMNFRRLLAPGDVLFLRKVLDFRRGVVNCPRPPQQRYTPPPPPPPPLHPPSNSTPSTFAAPVLPRGGGKFADRRSTLRRTPLMLALQVTLGLPAGRSVLRSVSLTRGGGADEARGSWSGRLRLRRRRWRRWRRWRRTSGGPADQLRTNTAKA